MSIVQSAIDRIKKSELKAASEARVAQRSLNSELPSQTSAARSRAALKWSPQAPVNLDVHGLRAQGLYPATSCVPRLNEEYRSIRREVIAASRETIESASEPVGPVVVITSALPGDGKSFTALNLALSIASEGVYDVLLIDADTIKRTITRACGLEDRAGLVELLLRSDAEFPEYSYSTSIARLHVLPAGNRTDDSIDAISAGRLGPLFGSIRAAMQGHFVIVDTPPLLVASETSALTDEAGQVLLVVHAGRTLQDSVKEALARVRESIPVGIVLNGWSPMLASERLSHAAYQEYTKK